MNQSSPPPDPNWSKLPHDPRGFFELEQGFARKELKRKYSQFIRVFKPEKAPVEFQKIRSAYEFLDGQLRYGNQGAVQSAQFGWDTAVEQGRAAQLPELAQTKIQNDGNDQHPKTTVAPIFQRIETESPELIFKELKSKTGKSPYEYFAMAMLSDLVVDDPLIFFKVLLTGIQKHSGEAGLTSLLYQFLRQDFDVKQIPAILKTTSKVFNNQHFYYLTEKLWDELLRKSNFRTWLNTLQECEQNLKDFRVEGKIAFYLHVLPATIWKSDGNWVLATLKFLNEHGTEIPDSLEMDFELVHYLVSYRKSIGQDDSYSKEIHQSIVDYFLIGGRKGDESIINLQSEFAQNPRKLLDAFGPEDPYNEHQIIVWDFINEEVCQRNALFSRVNPRELRAKIYDLMDDLNRSEYASFGWKEEFRYRMTNWGPYAGAIVTPFALLFSWLNNPIILSVAVILMITGILLVKFWYKPSDRYENYIEKRMRIRYHADWRRRFALLYEATQLSHHEISDALVEVVQSHHERLGFAAWLCRFLPADAGLHFYASSTRYLK